MTSGSAWFAPQMLRYGAGRAMRSARRMGARLLGPCAFGQNGLVRWGLRRWLARDLAALAGSFDPHFYLSQIASPAMRGRALRDPALHYLLVGAHRLLTPAPGFDLRRQLEANPHIPAHRLFVDAPPPRVPSPLSAPPRDGRPAALLLDHARGGGSSRYLDIYARALEAEGFRVVRSIRLSCAQPRFVIAEGGRWQVHGLDEGLKPLLARLGVTRLVVNHVIDMPADAFRRLPALVARLGLEYETILHDYFPVCPRVNLVDPMGRYCGLPEPAQCAGCLADTGINPTRWRADAASFLAGAVRVTVPGGDLAARLGKVFPAIRLRVFEPEVVQRERLPRPARMGGPRRILVIGALNQAKGYDVVLGLARAARASGAPVQITLLGYSMDDGRLRQAGVEVLGRYRDTEAAGLIDQLAPDLALFPAIWPETWSFTLSHALRAGLTIAAFDIGAIAARLRSVPDAHVLPHALRHCPEALLEAVVRIMSGGQRPALPASWSPSLREGALAVAEAG